MSPYFSFSGARELAPVVLRVGLAILYLWFGMTQLIEPNAWVSWVPAWSATFGFEAQTVVLLNGAFETVLGLLLAFGILVRWAALLLALHLLLIVFEIGLNSVGVRDLGLMFATFALALFGPDRFSLVGDR